MARCFILLWTEVRPDKTEKPIHYTLHLDQGAAQNYATRSAQSLGPEGCKFTRVTECGEHPIMSWEMYRKLVKGQVVVCEYQEIHRVVHDADVVVGLRLSH